MEYNPKKSLKNKKINPPEQQKPRKLEKQKTKHYLISGSQYPKKHLIHLEMQISPRTALKGFNGH